MKNYLIVLFFTLFNLSNECFSMEAYRPSTALSGEKSLRKYEVITEIDRTLSDMAFRDLFSGAVLISRDNNIVFKKAYGHSNKSTFTPNLTNTKFNLGSINKLFTNVAILQLAEQGKLSLNDKLIKHLPDYPMKETASIITIQQLLEMTSGLGDFTGPEFENTPKNEIKDLKDYVQFFQNKELSFTPGSGKQYSDAGYILLGLVIEAISGQDYYSYVKENIFEPTGMNNTDFYTLSDKVDNRAVGFTGVRDNWKNYGPNIENLTYRGTSASGGYSTVDDIFLFVNALRDGKLLSPGYSAYVMTQEFPLNDPVLPLKNGNLCIQGGAPGVNCCINYNAETGEMIVVLGNYDPPVATNAVRKIRELMNAWKSDEII